MMRPMGRRLLSVGTLLLALCLGLGLAGCGAASEDYEVDGVDALTIPTPSPDPEDFVRYVDNPWLPLEPGSTWTYDVVVGAEAGRSTATVEPANLRLDGVAVTVVRTETTVGDGPATEQVDYFAQDRDGNVWWFGRQGVWDVEVAGAEAGLAMPAEPRVGDGWRRALLEGVVEDVLTVESVEDSSVVLRVESDLAPDLVVQEVYDRGIGLTRTFNMEGPPGSSVLVSGP
jgi:hypothetical protein